MIDRFSKTEPPWSGVSIGMVSTALPRFKNSVMSIWFARTKSHVLKTLVHMGAITAGGYANANARTINAAAYVRQVVSGSPSHTSKDPRLGVHSVTGWQAEHIQCGLGAPCFVPNLEPGMCWGPRPKNGPSKTKLTRKRY